MTIAQIYENAKRKLNNGITTLGEFNDMVDRECVILPNHATNGDVIKAMFPFVLKPITHDDSHIQTAVLTFAEYFQATVLTFDRYWWNAPYKAESEEV